MKSVYKRGGFCTIFTSRLCRHTHFQTVDRDATLTMSPRRNDVKVTLFVKPECVEMTTFISTSNLNCVILRQVTPPPLREKKKGYIRIERCCLQQTEHNGTKLSSSTAREDLSENGASNAFQVHDRSKIETASPGEKRCSIHKKRLIEVSTPRKLCSASPSRKRFSAFIVISHTKEKFLGENYHRGKQVRPGQRALALH